MSLHDVAAATEAVQGIGLLLTRKNEPNRVARAPGAAGHARAGANATYAIAEAIGTQSAKLDAETANSMAATAEELLKLF